MKTWTWNHGDIETWTHGHMDTWTWRHGHGDMELTYWGILKPYNKKIKQETEHGSPGNFPYSIYRLLIVQAEICRLSVC
jgi:hypothetical protein